MSENKEHVKLYKSKKKWVTATICTTALGISGTVLAGNIKADNINSSSTGSASVSESSTTEQSSISSKYVSLSSSKNSSSNAISTSSSAQTSTSENSSTSGNTSSTSDLSNSSSENVSSVSDASNSSVESTSSISAANSSSSKSGSLSSESNNSMYEGSSSQNSVESSSLSSEKSDESSNTIKGDSLITQDSTTGQWQQSDANKHDNGLIDKINQEAKQNEVTFKKQFSDIKAIEVYNKLNDMGKKLAQAANLNLAKLSESEIKALNKVKVDGTSYDGQLTYDQFQQFGNSLINKDEQFAIPNFDKDKIENFPAATTNDAQSGQIEDLDIWDSWPVVEATTGKPVNYNGYQLVIGMMGVGSNWNDGHLYLLYNKYGNDNFNDWKCAGPIFGFNASDRHQQWSGSAAINSDNSIQLYYTEDDVTDGNNHQQIATATIYLNCDNGEIKIENVTNRKILFAGDGYYYQSYEQWKQADNKLDNFCLRDPHVFEQDGKRYLIFEAGTGTYNYQSNDQIYNLSNYGGKTIADDINDLFSIINNQNMSDKASFANACIGLMELGGTEKDPTIAKLFAPIVSSPMVSDELERPVTIKIGDKYYLFTDTRLNRGIDNKLNNEANQTIGDNVGMLGFVSDSLDGNYKPLNGSGVVLTATVPNHDRTSEYSWYAVPMFDEQGNTTNYILITAYMSNRNEAAGEGLNATWAPSFVVRINADDTTEVLGDSVTAQQGIWVAPIVTTASHKAIQAQENPNAVQVNENGKWYLRENGKNLTGFQYIKNQNKTVYYDLVSGQMLFGQQKINGYWYYFDLTTGAMKFGYQLVNGSMVYFNPVTGSLEYGTIKEDVPTKNVQKENSQDEKYVVHADTVSAVKAAQKNQSNQAQVSTTDETDVIHFETPAPSSILQSDTEVEEEALPQMGNSSSKATLWGEISLAMAGILGMLGLTKKKRHE